MNFSQAPSYKMSRPLGISVGSQKLLDLNDLLNFALIHAHIAITDHGSSKHIEKILDKLIESGTINNELDATSGVTPLILAAEKGNIKIVQYLLNKGADIYQTDKFNRNAYEAAKAENHTDVMEAVNPSIFSRIVKFFSELITKAQKWITTMISGQSYGRDELSNNEKEYSLSQYEEPQRYNGRYKKAGFREGPVINYSKGHNEQNEQNEQNCVRQPRPGRRQ